MSELPIGKGEIRRQGKGCALLAFGSMLGTALQVGEELDATVANMRFVKPIDRDLILSSPPDTTCWSPSRKRHHRRRRLGSRACSTRPARPRAPAGPARPLHRPRRPGPAARRIGLDAAVLDRIEEAYQAE
jgi:hypothetical protein